MTKKEIALQEYLNILSEIKGYDTKQEIIFAAQKTVNCWKKKLEERINPICFNDFQNDEEYIKFYGYKDVDIQLEYPTLYDKEVYVKFKNNTGELYNMVCDFACKIAKEFPNNNYARAIGNCFVEEKVLNASEMISEITTKYTKENLYTISEKYSIEEYPDVELYDKYIDYLTLSLIELNCLIICINKRVETLLTERSKIDYIYDYEEWDNVDEKIRNYNMMLEAIEKELEKRGDTPKLKLKKNETKVK